MLHGKPEKPGTSLLPILTVTGPGEYSGVARKLSVQFQV
jgi:hypothetical protein